MGNGTGGRGLGAEDIIIDQKDDKVTGLRAILGSPFLCSEITGPRDSWLFVPV
jgi:hypothetical protein